MKIRRAVIGVLASLLLAGASSFAAAPCPAGSERIACVIPLEYGIGAKREPFSASGQGVFASQEHEGHFNNSLSHLLGPVTAEIGRQSNLLPLASPSSGILLTYDSSLKTFVPRLIAVWARSSANVRRRLDVIACSSASAINSLTSTRLTALTCTIFRSCFPTRTTAWTTRPRQATPTARGRHGTTNLAARLSATYLHREFDRPEDKPVHHLRDFWPHLSHRSFGGHSGRKRSHDAADPDDTIILGRTLTPCRRATIWKLLHQYLPDPGPIPLFAPPFPDQRDWPRAAAAVRIRRRELAMWWPE